MRTLITWLRTQAPPISLLADACSWESAAAQDFLVNYPARKIKVPAQLRATDTTTLTWDQLRLALSKLNLRDRILLELDMTNALRPSELFAFRWKRFDYQASTLTVAETVYKGNIRDWGKTKKSLTVIHIPLELADDLQASRMRRTCPRSRDEGQDEVSLSV